MFYYLDVFGTETAFVCALLYIMVIGVINMYNFMDGINGITGAYSLVVLGGLQYVNLYRRPFIEKDMIWVPVIGCLVFLFFNFRKKARCFAGDVGSVTIAFWVIFLILDVILKTGNWGYILFLSVYGIDSVLTIAHRLILKQNIFKAHRLHFYQILANEQKVPHLLVSTGYAVLQAAIIGLVIVNTVFTLLILFFLIITPLAVVYILFKSILIKAK
jgi:UDP-N-acetylmuramyl pentapeptide phosphotransferase/UDP-N-acetylglucosamine-1-phosphate transferase